ncbi:type 2 lanthipeptide synthetase LanM family protein [Kutzneria buriramensis]|uniref:Type 2 lantibiotic biosynthesis protein LanM n=1 Tax=Kutzneria buriramensis TaxID=1045776 RepID=A0A3E0GYX5_9PSEU|nr:type 2 lanthipeptide synthetase LanM family protein [Kutzneria buriramensis]REH35146.1 type 2 lantibiotic biosynthesis protein LanM [Kutzneria buriramensis]
MKSATFWWAGGLTLHERLPRPSQQVSGTANALERLERWRRAHEELAPDWFERRLAATGLDVKLLTGLLAEAPDALARRVARPGWADFVDSALTSPSGRRKAFGDDWLGALAAGLRPLVEVAESAVAGRAHADVTSGFVHQLGRCLARLAARTLVLQLNRARARGQLAGRTPAERFAEFARRPDLDALFAEYPVLARLLAQTCQQAVAAHLELLERVAADRDAIVETLLGGVDPGELVRIEPTGGDAHQHGRSVALLTFADGRVVVYKPRPLDLHAHFNDMLDWLNGRITGLDLRKVALLRGDGYGWQEFVDAAACDEVSGLSRFYRRQGVLLALLYAVDGSDMHYENLIAAGDQPVLVDVETLFHPTMQVDTATGHDPAAQELVRSVFRTALLPQVMLGENGSMDVSGLGGDKGVFPTDGVGWDGAGTDSMRLVRRPVAMRGGRNRPRLGEQEAEPRDYQAALLTGFQAGYDAIVEHRAEFVALLRTCAADELRFVARPTQLYATLLDESTHPDVLRDALDRDSVFDLLWTDSLDDPMRRRLVPHEIADLWAGDVPMFTCPVGSRDVFSATGVRLPNLLAVSGLDAVEAKIADMGEIDRHNQEWLIRASFATRPQPVRHQGVDVLPGHVATVVPDPQRLLAAACGIADELVGRAVPGAERTNWLGLELVDDKQWTVLPMGAGLANGYPGLALFLAQLAELTGAPRYGDLARRAIQPIPRLLDALGDDLALALAVGSGGFHGLGGICYALARLHRLLGDDAEVLGWLTTAVRLATALETEAGDESADLANGLAGGLAAMLAVHAETGLATAGTLAIRYADRLATGRHGTTDATGFARGPGGAGWALLRLASVIGSDRHETAGDAFLAADGDPTVVSDHGWCGGLSGTTLARIGRPDEGLARRVDALAGHAPLRDLSLCHGELGAIEALTVLGRAGDERAAAAVGRRAGLVLGSLDQYGARCGTPNEVPTPGLLSGLAGIGYGLLRLGFTEQVPSVLLLDSSHH